MTNNTVTLPPGTYSFSSDYGFRKLVKITYFPAKGNRVRATVINNDQVSEFRCVDNLIKEIVNVELLGVF